MTQAMDVARGGRFEGIPSPVPAEAWYSFTEPSCSYECQGTEYIYWAVNAWVGALVNRGDSIQAEWKLETREKLEATDLKITEVIKDTSTYRLPNVSPTGHYTGPAICPATSAATEATSATEVTTGVTTEMTTKVTTEMTTEVTTEVTELCDSRNSGICLCNFISNFIQVASCENMSLTFVYESTFSTVEDINIVELTQILTQQLNTALQIDLGNIELSAVSQFVIQSTSLITSTDVTLGAITTGIIQQLGDLQWESITLAEVEQLVIQQAAGLQQLNAARNIELEDITLGGVSQGIIKVLEDISLFGAYTWISEQLQNILPIQVQAEDIEDIVQWLISELGSLSVGREEVTLNDVFNEVSERLDSSSITTLGELNSVYNSLNYGDFTLGEVYLWIVQLLADVAQEETATETAVDTEVPAVLQTLEQITLDNVSQFIFQQLDSITVTGVQDWIIQVLGSASVPAGKHSPIFVLLFQYDLHLSVSAPADSGYEGSWPLQTSPVSMFPKFTTVFGVPVFAASSVSVWAPPHTNILCESLVFLLNLC